MSFKRKNKFWFCLMAIIFCFCLNLLATKPILAACFSVKGTGDEADTICPSIESQSSCDANDSCIWEPAAGDSTGGSGGSGGSVTLTNPLGGTVDINTLIGKIINGALGIVGSLALLMFIYGGFTWMLAAGSSERVKKGKDILIWATLGLVIIFSAYAIVSFLFANVLK